ncbi:cobalt-precorrin-5B (C(1))-methyltransferase [Hyphomicrobiales bacterium 4NK60-0047b]
MVENTDADKKLKFGWTTGACATAATKAAFEALITGVFPKAVTITLPKGQTPTFAVTNTKLNADSAIAGIIKDAGDDPDVTHGATIISTVSWNEDKSNKISSVTFKAGPGVGMVTKPGLPIPPGEPAINPVPRELMTKTIEELAKEHSVSSNVIIEISVPNGEKIAKSTWNGRLGIVGGLSILGTTGVVVPYSCSAWIHSIHRGIDVARATNTDHIGAAVGNMSEKLILETHPLTETDLIDMGDFVGGMLKYLKKNPVPKVTIAGGFAKMSKLAMGEMDLHSKRSQVDKTWLASLLSSLGAAEEIVSKAKTANTALEILNLAQDNNLEIGTLVAEKAKQSVDQKLAGTTVDGDADCKIEILICDRKGQLVGRAAGEGF